MYAYLEIVLTRDGEVEVIPEETEIGEATAVADLALVHMIEEIAETIEEGMITETIEEEMIEEETTGDLAPDHAKF